MNPAVYFFSAGLLAEVVSDLWAESANSTVQSQGFPHRSHAGNITVLPRIILAAQQPDEYIALISQIAPVFHI